MSQLPRKDESVHEAGATAEDLGKEGAVDFLHQERTSDGAVSRFHKFVRSDG